MTSSPPLSSFAYQTPKKTKKIKERKLEDYRRVEFDNWNNADFRACPMIYRHIRPDLSASSTIPETWKSPWTVPSSSRCLFRADSYFYFGIVKDPVQCYA